MYLHARAPLLVSVIVSQTARRVRATIDRMSRDERGATAVEYGLIAVLCVLALWAGVEALGIALGELLPSQDQVDDEYGR